MSTKTACLKATLPPDLYAALWEHCELTGAKMDREVERAIRALLIGKHGDRYGMVFERLDRMEGFDVDGG